jgi:hypothetical protein
VIALQKHLHGEQGAYYPFFVLPGLLPCVYCCKNLIEWKGLRKIIIDKWDKKLSLGMSIDVRTSKIASSTGKAPLKKA